MISEPEWLIRLRVELQEITEHAARTLWPGKDGSAYFNYRLEHVGQVERDARRLLAVVGGDVDVVLAAVWTHDRFQPQFEGEAHAARAGEWVARHLVELGFSPSKVEAVRFAVAHHSDPFGAIPEGRHEARLLWDADKLSKVGALYAAAYLLAVPAFSERITFQRLAQRRSLRPAAGTVVDRFYFEPSPRWAAERVRAESAFYGALADEAGDV